MYRKSKNSTCVTRHTESRDQAKAGHSGKSTQLSVYGCVCLLADRSWGSGGILGVCDSWARYFVYTTRETRVGWPLLTIETVVNGGSGWSFGVCDSGASSFVYTTRDTREGWPLLTVETEVNGDSKSTNERGPSLVSSLGSSYRYTRLLSYLGCSMVSLEQNIFSSPYAISIYAQPHRPETWAGSRRGPPVSECVVSVHNSPIHRVTPHKQACKSWDLS